MVKIGNKVSLFHNIGKEGTVVNLIPVKIKTSFTDGTSTNSWRVVIDWKDGSRSVESVADVMRID